MTLPTYDGKPYHPLDTACENCKRGEHNCDEKTPCWCSLCWKKVTKRVSVRGERGPYDATQDH